jgi:hypothetical protein
VLPGLLTTLRAKLLFGFGFGFVLVLLVAISSLAELGAAGIRTKPFDPLRLPGDVANALHWNEKRRLLQPLWVGGALRTSCAHARLVSF